MRLRSVPVLIPVVVAVLMVAFCTRAALSQNALQSERFLGYFDDTANLRWGGRHRPALLRCQLLVVSAQRSGGYL